MVTVKDSVRYYLSPPSSSGEYEIYAIVETLSLVGVGSQKVSINVYASKSSALAHAESNGVQLIQFGDKDYD